METIRNWALGLCTAAIGSTVLLALVPKRGVGKLLPVLASAFLLCLLVAPLASIAELPALSLEKAPVEIQDGMLTDRLNRQMRDQMETAASSIADTVLQAYGYAAKKVTIGTDISAEGYIYMDRITVYVDKENAAHAGAIRTLLQQRFGVSVTVEEWIYE